MEKIDTVIKLLEDIKVLLTPKVSFEENTDETPVVSEKPAEVPDASVATDTSEALPE